MKDITKRDVKVFLLGMLAMLFITLIYNWDEAKRGARDAVHESPIK